MSLEGRLRHFDLLRDDAKVAGLIDKLLDSHRLPWFLVRPFILIADFLVNDLQLDLAGSGMPRDPFGSAMVTSVGMFGIDVGYPPFTPIARCPMILLVGEVSLRPWVVDGELAVRKVMNLSASFDHRLIDGYHAGVLARELRTLLAAPETMEV